MRKRIAGAMIILVCLIAPAMLIQDAAAAQPPTASLYVSSSLQNLAAGATNDVVFTVTNTGGSDAINATVQITLPSSISGAPMIFLNSNGNSYIGSLAPNSSVAISEEIFVSSSAAGNLFTLTFTMSYIDNSTGIPTPKVDTRTIGVIVPVVSNVGAFISPSLSSYQLNISQNDNITLYLSNIGSQDASSVTVSLTMPGAATGSSPLSLINSNGKYVFNDIAAGTTVSIPLTINPSYSAAGQNFQIGVTVTYTDSIKVHADNDFLTVSVPFTSSPSTNLVTSITPSTLEAGQINTVNINITNIGDSTATSVQAILTLPTSVSGVPLALENSDGKYSISNISAGQSVLLPASIYVSPSAAGSIYPLTLTMSYYDIARGSMETTRTLDVNVPSVVGPLLNYAISSSQLTSGELNNLTLTVQNIGDETANSITIQLTLPGAQTGTSTTVLQGSDGVWSFSNISVGQTENIPLQIFVNPSASGTVMSLSLTSTYTAAGFKAAEQSNSLGMIIRGNVDPVVLGVSTFPEDVVPGQPFSLTVNFINLGTATAQSVLLTPSGTGPIQPSSTSSLFLGDLAIDVPSSFSISYSTTNSLTSGSYSVNLTYTYKDPLGDNFTSTLVVPFAITVGTNSTTTGSTSHHIGLLSLLLPIVIIIVIILIAVYLVRRRRSSK
jgi:hypothetical protein